MCVYIMNEWAHVGVCEQGSPVLLVSSFLSEIKVKWVIYHEDMWPGHFSLVCVRVHVCASILKAILKVCGARAAAVCMHVRVCGGHLSLPVPWLMVYIGLFSHACFSVYRFMLSPIKAP